MCVCVIHTNSHRSAFHICVVLQVREAIDHSLWEVTIVASEERNKSTLDSLVCLLAVRENTCSAWRKIRISIRINKTKAAA